MYHVTLAGILVAKVVVVFVVVVVLVVVVLVVVVLVVVVLVVVVLVVVVVTLKAPSLQPNCKAVLFATLVLSTRTKRAPRHLAYFGLYLNPLSALGSDLLLHFI